MDHFDPNMIEDAIIRKRATQFIGGGAPKTYTRLYLYPAGSEVMKSRNVFNLLNAYGYFMPIPVSPSNLEYKRGASHNEAYGIVSGGLLQRNLPKLWHLTIDTYLPRDIYERTFHNWSQDREWSGEYTQQSFVDYINLVMQYKIPLALFDSSSPERIRHNAEYWCIEQFNYKMQPHDDIDYTLELIEWKEPHVKLSEIEMKEVTRTPTGPSVRRGDGTALMVFGTNDPRAYNEGEVYNANIKLAFTMREGSLVSGYAKLNDLKQALREAISGSVKSLNGGDVWSGEVRLDSVGWVDGTAVVPYHIKYAVGNARGANRARASAMAQMQSDLTKVIYMGMRKSASTMPLNASVLGAKSADGKITNVVSATTYDPKTYSGYKTTKLRTNAWCNLREVRKKVPLYTLKLSADVERTAISDGKKDEYGSILIKLEQLRVWFNEMYVVSPTRGTKLAPNTGKAPSGDLYYDAKQSWLVPKENTIRTSYKKYLATVLVVHNPSEDEWWSWSDGGKNGEVSPNKENNLGAVQETIVPTATEGWKTTKKEVVYNKDPHLNVDIAGFGVVE